MKSRLFWYRIEQLVDFNEAWLIEQLGVSRSTFATWKKRQTIPKVEIVISLSKILNTTVESLMSEVVTDSEKNLIDEKVEVESAYGPSLGSMSSRKEKSSGNVPARLNDDEFLSDLEALSKEQLKSIKLIVRSMAEYQRKLKIVME